MYWIKRSENEIQKANEESNATVVTYTLQCFLGIIEYMSTDSHKLVIIVCIGQGT